MPSPLGRGWRVAPGEGSRAIYRGVHMTALRIDVDRLQISLHGVSATVAEDFSTRIGRALEQRLSGLPADAVTADPDGGYLTLSGSRRLESRT